jgi:hypothetical protein
LVSPAVGGNTSAFEAALISTHAGHARTAPQQRRNELTERNRNIRAAGFEMLTKIGSLQQIIFLRQTTLESLRALN